MVRPCDNKWLKIQNSDQKKIELRSLQNCFHFNEVIILVEFSGSNLLWPLKRGQKWQIVLVVFFNKIAVVVYSYLVVFFKI